MAILEGAFGALNASGVDVGSVSGDSAFNDSFRDFKCLQVLEDPLQNFQPGQLQ